MRVRVIEKEGRFIPEYYKDNVIAPHRWVNCSSLYTKLDGSYATLKEAKEACHDFVDYCVRKYGKVVWEERVINEQILTE